MVDDREEFEVTLSVTPPVGVWKVGQLVEFPSQFNMGDGLFVITSLEGKTMRIKKWVSNTVPRSD